MALNTEYAIADALKNEFPNIKLCYLYQHMRRTEASVGASATYIMRSSRRQRPWPAHVVH